MELHALLVECANQEGFPLAGTIDLDLAFSDATHSIQPHIHKYDQWIHAGHAAQMDYLVRGRDRRANPRLLFPEAESMLCVAIPYPRKSGGTQSGPRYARYLQGNDYHVELAEKLERVMKQAQEKHPDLRWKICVDTSAILERSWAALAGLGWIGKNTLLIHPKYGSYLFLAEVLINQRTHRGPQPLPNYCGNCRKCLEGCPTQALKAPRTLDSNRCISYWTLEKRGSLEIPEKDRANMQSWVAGCDICQEVCPFNIKPVKQEELSPLQVPPNATDLNTWLELLRETPEEYKLRVRESAMKRIKPAQFSRNLAIILTNYIEQLESQELQAFQCSLGPLLRQRLEEEQDPTARLEWQRCNDSIRNHSYLNKSLE